jgi:NAD(P)-dependent dehydrogenase (short-subunit alcohol dehydrogenase family)
VSEIGVAIVTGAGSGLGQATARALARQGAAVACVDVRDDAARETARDLGEGAFPVACDVTDADAVAAAVATTLQRCGRLDAIVNAAGVDHTRSIEDMTIAQWDQVIGVNLRGPFLFAKAAFPHMKRQRRGHIVNVASTGALRMWANASAYHASKAGLVAFSRGLGVEGRPYGIRVTTLIPGGMRTHFFDRFAVDGIPAPDPSKLQDPEVVADAIRYVLSTPASSAIQELLITPLEETSWP